MVIAAVACVTIEEAAALPETERGGGSFGSTGSRHPHELQKYYKPTPIVI
jgi:hypothetical protein